MDEPVCDGSTPLDVLLALMHEARAARRDQDAFERAKAAAPYVHARAGAKIAAAAPGEMLNDEQLRKYIVAGTASDADLPRGAASTQPLGT